jgi:hypothetical protein
MDCGAWHPHMLSWRVLVRRPFQRVLEPGVH